MRTRRCEVSASHTSSLPLSWSRSCGNQRSGRISSEFPYRTGWVRTYSSTCCCDQMPIPANHDAQARRAALLTWLIHKIASNPVVYDVSQKIAGSGPLDPVLAKVTSTAAANARVLDVGGGTGRSRHLWPRTCTYVLIDSDAVMLSGLAAARRPGFPVRGDATKLPIARG